MRLNHPKYRNNQLLFIVKAFSGRNLYKNWNFFIILLIIIRIQVRIAMFAQVVFCLLSSPLEWLWLLEKLAHHFELVCDHDSMVFSVWLTTIETTIFVSECNKKNSFVHWLNPMLYHKIQTKYCVCMHSSYLFELINLKL